MKAKGLLEKIILASSVIGITATASYLIYNKPSLKRVDKTDQGIGYVRPIGSDVRVKEMLILIGTISIKTQLFSSKTRFIQELNQRRL